MPLKQNNKIGKRVKKDDFLAAKIGRTFVTQSIEYFEYKVEKCREYHEGLKSGKYPRQHSFSLTYAKKELNEAEKNLQTAKKLWAYFEQM